MAVWALSDAGLHAMGGQLLASSLLTTVTSGGAHAVGSWTQLPFPSAATTTPFNVSRFRIHLGKAGVALTGNNRQWMFDVGVGAAGSETILAQSIAFGGNLAYASWDFPINIPIGSRVAVRAQAITALSSTTMGLMVMGGGMGVESGHRATTYGAVPASSRGTILTAPAATNTESTSWTELTASTTYSMRWMVVGLAAPNVTAATAGDHLIDIGVGGAGAEAPVISDIACSVATTEQIDYARNLTFPVNIPAGSRLVARYRGTSTATAASPSVTVTGIC